MTDSKVDCKLNFDCRSLEHGSFGAKLLWMAKKTQRPRYFKAHRKSRELTLDQLAERTGLSVSMLSLLERGKRDYSEETLYQLADGLNCEVGELFNPPNPPKNELADFIMKLDESKRSRAIKVIRAAFEGEEVTTKKRS